MKEDKKNNSKRFIIPQLMIVALFLFVSFTSLYWLIYVHPYVSTGDAYIEGHQIQISPESDGKILEGKVQEGDKVKKGQVLFKLDDDLLQSEKKHILSRVSSLRETVANFQKDLDQKMNAYLENIRAKGTQREKIDSNLKDLDDARTLLESSKTSLSLEVINLEHIEYKLAKRVIEAPFDGVVTKCHFHPGSFVEKNDKVLCVYDSTKLSAYAYIKEGEIKKVKVGAEVNICLKAYPDHPFKGTVDFISPSVKRIKKKKLIPIKISIDSSQLSRQSTQDILLGHGMSANVKIKVN